MNTKQTNTNRLRLMPFQMTRDILKVWKYAYRPFLLFELIYKLLTISVFIPLLSIIFNKLLAVGGFEAAANHDLLRFLFSKYGLLSVLVMVPIAIMLIYTEFTVLFYIAYYGIQEKRPRIRPVLFKAISSLPGLWRIGVFGLALYLLLLFPLLDANIGGTLLPNMTVPNFITGELMKTTFGTIALVIVGLLILALNLICIYALPIMVLEGKYRFWNAVRESKRLFWRSKWSLVRAVFEWVVIFLFLFILLICLIILIVLLLPSGDGESRLMTTIGVMLSLGLYIATLIMTPMFITIITLLYVRYQGHDHVNIDTDGVDATVWKGRDMQRSLMRRYRSMLTTFGLFILIVIGWGATALLTDWGETNEKFIIMAHRGDTTSGIENTIGAFEGAIRTGADYIELDILQTKDGKLAVIHDENLRRLSGKNVNVFDLSLAELQQISLRVGKFQDNVPSLDEVLERTKGKIKLNVELKTHGHEKNFVSILVDTIRRHKAEQQIILQSLDYELVKKVKKAAPDLTVGYVIFATFASLNQFDADFFVVEESFARPRLISSAKIIGKPIYVWTVNDVKSVEHLYTLGVDGIITDIAVDAKETVQKLQKE
ncbi:glycerophosphodiester phosphodiesterase [Lysinibacillus sp. KCTC 33748]|uniref:glycerophosphodiester phosphodiesterase n=1 Tax=unclassified Lysinibacillus TaxID=2636778 RepID=UPI0009A6161F|nr:MULTISPECIES: glycerophosphodiester phosphodiesterase [unclassified Lysinibacillus]OXS77214.1 glycerophosphodiester phosphodiesterase [Lysinibacillus sp. KCTC 33748]SKB31641.1 glycerophosphoryl diester phosphodiesterase [Lysinibacillus sp. AC-3]